MLYNRNNTVAILSDEIMPWDVAEALRSLQVKNLKTLLISSPGGCATALLYGVEYLLQRKVTTIAGKQASSAGLDLFLCGHERLALPESTFMFHEAGENVGNNKRICKTEMELLMEIAILVGNLGEAKLLARKLAAVTMFDKMTADLFQRQTRLNASMVMRLMRGEGCTMDAKEALFYGIVHRIIPPSSVEI